MCKLHTDRYDTISLKDRRIFRHSNITSRCNFLLCEFVAKRFLISVPGSTRFLKSWTVPSRQEIFSKNSSFTGISGDRITCRPSRLTALCVDRKLFIYFAQPSVPCLIFDETKHSVNPLWWRFRSTENSLNLDPTKCFLYTF